jgi:phenylalanyl-tRNA synthetase alpha subunit
MKTVIMRIIFFIFLSTSVISCGISKEVRVASSNLVQKQKQSLEAHKKFHKGVINALNTILNAELANSEKVYNTSINDQNLAIIEVIKELAKDQDLSDLNKRLKEEEARQKINARIKKAQTNYLERNEALTNAKNKLKEASANLIEAEKYKLTAIDNLNSYLQQKRPSDKLLEMINIDLAQYSKYVNDANKALLDVDNYMDKLKK